MSICFLRTHRLQQRGSFKTEPGEVRENRPNLRRRMGTYVGKQEPGKNKASRAAGCLQEIVGLCQM